MSSVLEDGIEFFKKRTDRIGLSRPLYGKRGLDGFSKSILDFFLNSSGRITEVSPSNRRKILLVMVDALGISTILRHRRYTRGLLNGAKFIDFLSSTAPTTTATALATLATGAPPALHGISGYNMYFRELSSTAISFNIKNQKDEEKKISLLAKNTIYKELKKNGIDSCVLIKRHYLESLFTNDIVNGANTLEYVALSDAMSRTLSALKSINEGLVVSYWAEIDTLSHVYGPGSKEVELGLRMFMSYIKAIIKEAIKLGSIVILIADHGQIDVKKEIELKGYPFLEKSVLLPFGEKRFSYLISCEKISEDDLGDLKEVSELFSLSEYKILFGGKISKKLWTRFGNYIIASKDGVIFLVKKEENKLLGHHGGLTPEELAVPLLIFY